MNLDATEGLELIKTAYQKQAEERLWQRWLVDYSNMDQEHFMSFEDYKNKVFKPQNTTNTKLDAKAIIVKAEKIKALDQARGGKR